MESTERDTAQRRMLHDYLALHDDERCPNCLYRLHQLTSETCPECGTALRLSVGRREQPIGAWLLLAVPLLIVSGEGLYNICWAASTILFNHTFADLTFIDVAVVVLTIACVPLALIALIVRPWYVRMPFELQWGIAAPVAGVTTLLMLFDLTYYNFIMIF